MFSVPSIVYVGENVIVRQPEQKQTKMLLQLDRSLKLSLYSGEASPHCDRWGSGLVRILNVQKEVGL